MKLSHETFINIYSNKETDELLSLHSSGNLTSEAYDALEEVLRNRGIESAKRPTLSEGVGEKEAVVGWGNFFSWLLIALSLCVMASRIFLSDLPNTGNVFPGSTKDIVGRIITDIGMFIVVFIFVSIPTIVFNRLGKHSVKASMPKLLRTALVWTIIIEALLIWGGWLGTKHVV